MAFEVDDNKGKPQHPNDRVLQQRQPAEEQPVSTARTEERRAEDRTLAQRTLRNMNTMFGRPMDRRSTGEYLAKFAATMNKVFHPEDQPISGTTADVSLDKFRVIAMDQAEHFTTVSACVVMLPFQQSDGIHVFAHTFLLEGSAPPPAPLPGDFNGRRYDIIQTAGDLWNEKFLSKVTDVCMKQFAGGTVHFYDAGVQVVTQNVAPDDAETIRQLAFYATAALTTLSVEVLKYQQAWALDLLDKRDTLDVCPDFSGEPILSACGQPRRTDVKLSLAASIYEEEGVVRQPLTLVGGQLELVYSPPKRGGEFGFGRRDREETQHFYPLFNITTLDTQYKMVSLELLLLGLGSTAMLSDNLYWVYGFRGAAARSKHRKDMRDVGALNYLVGGQYFDTKAASVTDEVFLDYFGTLCHADLAYGMHVDERGELSWINQLFLSAAAGDQAAVDAIIDSADVLTEGHFSRTFKEMGGIDLVHPGENRIILGTYKDEDGNVRDLRDIDLLYLLNLRGDTDTELALDYQDTFDRVDLPINYRIERRIAILQSILGGSMKIDGFARQVYFDLTFVRALARAIHNCGAVINRVSTNAQYLNTRARGNDRIGRYAGSNLGSGLFNTWGGPTGSDRTGDRLFMGRVRRF